MNNNEEYLKDLLLKAEEKGSIFCKHTINTLKESAKKYMVLSEEYDSNNFDTIEEEEKFDYVLGDFFDAFMDGFEEEWKRRFN